MPLPIPKLAVESRLSKRRCKRIDIMQHDEADWCGSAPIFPADYRRPWHSSRISNYLSGWKAPFLFPVFMFAFFSVKLLCQPLLALPRTALDYLLDPKSKSDSLVRQTSIKVGAKRICSPNEIVKKPTTDNLLTFNY